MRVAGGGPQDLPGSAVPGAGGAAGPRLQRRLPRLRTARNVPRDPEEQPFFRLSLDFFFFASWSFLLLAENGKVTIPCSESPGESSLAGFCWCFSG